MPVMEQGLVGRFDRTLRKYNPGNYSKLQAALPEQEIVAYLRKSALRDEDLQAVFGWKNGFDPYASVLVSCEIARFGAILSLEASGRLIAATHNQLWPAGYIPFLLSGRGQVLLFNNVTGPGYGKLYFTSGSLARERRPISCYHSVSAWMETTILAYERSALRYDPGRGVLRVDIGRYNDLASAINSDAEFWRLDLATKLYA
jgi:hypothetical protein